MTQSVKGLPCKEEDSNSFTQNSWLKKKKRVEPTGTCFYLCTQEVESGGSPKLAGQPASQDRELQDNIHKRNGGK